MHCTHKMTLPPNRHIQISTGAGRSAEAPSQHRNAIAELH
jgi:hypothetical protein